MSGLLQKFSLSMAAACAVVLMISPGCSPTAAERSTGAEKSQGISLKLSGDQEVPAVKTAASGSGTIAVSSDKSVSGSVTTSGINGTAAHIHDGPAGKNGPVIIPLTKGPDNTWSVPAGTKLTDAQFASYQAGNLYVNVHSEANKGGEIRAQIKP